MKEETTGGASSRSASRCAASACRVVVLGASNVAYERRELGRTVAGVAAAAGPTELLVAGGYGRSYLRWSFVGPLGRPPVSRCGLWRRLEADDGSSRRVAVVTDVGNDLLYGHDVDETAAAVGRCLARLASGGFRTVVTRLPLERLRRLSRLEYVALCRLAYPAVPVCPWPEMRRRVEGLDAALGTLADRHDATTLSQPGDWYGLDPIHRRRRARAEFWRTVAASWGGPFASAGAAPVRGPAIDVGRPERFLWFGRRRRGGNILTTRSVSVRVY